MSLAQRFQAFAPSAFSLSSRLTIRHDEDQPGKNTVAIVSQSLWNRIFGQSATLSGQTLTLNRDIYTVVGIMPSKFDFPSSKTDVWVPLNLSPENKQNRDGRWLTVIARVKPGVAPKQVASDFDLVSGRLQVSNRLTFQIMLSRSKYKTNEQQVAFFSQTLDRISRQSGIVAAGGVSDLPLVGNRMSFKVLVEKSPVVSAQSPLQAGIRWSTPAYFDAIGMTLRRGRGFAEHDSGSSLPVAVVNQSMADRVWPGQDPIGMRVSIEEDPRWFTVVGIVGDIKQESLEADEGPTVYFTYAQKSEVWLNWMSVVIHTASDPHGVASLARQQILSLDKDQPITNIATLEQDLANLQMIPKLRTPIMSLFSFMAFSLAVVGMFGMVSFSVAQRSYEIGIRMALGAQRGDILRQFLVQGAVCVLIGVLLGIGGSLIVTRIMKALLFEVQPGDLKTFGLVAILLSLVTMLACWLPAGRATRMDVIKALRYE
ncbi:MAG TPA: ABC transporter permease [Candidatus Bathyarchaeia archaeon]|nr:ABC transporter permease [Candidatus Bathyarchaeia archaeon]